MIEKSNEDPRDQRRNALAESISTCDLMKEHSGGFTLKRNMNS